MQRLPQKRKRSSFSQDYLSYFSKKSEREFQLRQGGQKIKKKELDVQKRHLSQTHQVQQTQFLLMQQQRNDLLELIKSMQSEQQNEQYKTLKKHFVLFLILVCLLKHIFIFP